VLLSPAYVLCARCGARREGDPTIEALTWSGTHCPADSDRHRLAWDGDPMVTDTWLYRRDHQVAPEAAPPDLPTTRLPIRRHDGDGPLLLPHLGDTLVWDGERITIEAATDRPVAHAVPRDELTEHTDQDCPCGPEPHRVQHPDGPDGWEIVHRRLRRRPVANPAGET